MNTREITVVATKGGRIEKINTNVSTWGELRALIQDNYDLQNLKAVENINKTTLEHIDAVLPEGNFRLFLRPSKTKSGASSPDFSSMSFAEMKEFIKANEDAKSYLNETAKLSGRNWTQLKTEERREALIEWNMSLNNSQSTSTEEIAEEEITVDCEEVSLNNGQKIEKALQLLDEVVDYIDDEEAYEIFDNIKEDVETLKEYLPEEEDSSESEEERLEREDIERELRDMEDGF